MIAWALALMPVMLGTAGLAGRAGADGRGVVAAMMAAVVLMLLALMGIICRGEYVYWFSGGPSFEEAKAAGSEARREYANRHFAAMFKGSAAALALLAAEYFLGAGEIVMVLSAGACIVVAAISTVKIRWEANGSDPEN